MLLFSNLLLDSLATAEVEASQTLPAFEQAATLLDFGERSVTASQTLPAPEQLGALSPIPTPELTNVFDEFADKVWYQEDHDVAGVTQVGRTDLNSFYASIYPTADSDGSGALNLFNDQNLAGPAYVAIGTPDNGILSPETDFTLETSFKLTDATFRGMMVGIGENSTNAVDPGQILLGFDSSRRLELWWRRAGGGGFTVITTGSSYSTGVWRHFAISRQGTILRAFVDGVSVLSSTSFDDPTFKFDGVTPWVVTYGARPSFNRSTGGQYGNTRLTWGVARYTGTFTPPAMPFDQPLGPPFGEFTNPVATLAPPIGYVDQDITLPAFGQSALVNTLYAELEAAATLPPFGQAASILEVGTRQVATPDVGDPHYANVRLLLRGEVEPFIDTGPLGVSDPISPVPVNAASALPGTPKFENAIEFTVDSTASLGELSSRTGGSSATLEFWVRSNEPVLATIQCLAITVAIEPFGLTARSIAAWSSVAFAGTPTNVVRTLTPAVGMVDVDEWQHVAATWDGTDLALYLDGVLIGSNAVSAPVIDRWQISATGVLPGYSTGPSVKLWIDDLRYTANVVRYTAPFQQPIYEHPTAYGLQPEPFTQTATLVDTTRRITTTRVDPYIDDVAFLFRGEDATNSADTPAFIGPESLYSTGVSTTGALNAGGVIRLDDDFDWRIRIDEPIILGRTASTQGSLEGRVKLESMYFDALDPDAIEESTLFKTRVEVTGDGIFGSTAQYVNTVGVYIDPIGNNFFGLTVNQYPGSDLVMVRTSAAGTTVPALDTWYHLAIVQDGAQLRLFVDGRVEVEMTLAVADPFMSMSAVAGDTHEPETLLYTVRKGFLLEEFRSTVGVVRYPDVFVVPTAPHPVQPTSRLLPFAQDAELGEPAPGVTGAQTIPPFPLYSGFQRIRVKVVAEATQTIAPFTNQFFGGKPARMVESAQTLLAPAQTATVEAVRRVAAAQTLEAFANAATAAVLAKASASASFVIAQVARLGFPQRSAAAAQAVSPITNAGTLAVTARVAGAQLVAPPSNATTLNVTATLGAAAQLEPVSISGLIEGAFVPPSRRGYLIPPESRELLIL